MIEVDHHETQHQKRKRVAGKVTPTAVKQWPEKNTTQARGGSRRYSKKSQVHTGTPLNELDQP
jgi:hypothetical protein